MNEPNKLEYYITLGWKGLIVKNTLAYLSLSLSLSLPFSPSLKSPQTICNSSLSCLLTPLKGVSETITIMCCSIYLAHFYCLHFATFNLLQNL
jgi:hypothetical protein